MFKNTLDNKRYYTLNYFFKMKFGQKVFKVPLDINSTCPNQINVDVFIVLINLVLQ